MGVRVVPGDRSAAGVVMLPAEIPAGIVAQGAAEPGGACLRHAGLARVAGRG